MLVLVQSDADPLPGFCRARCLPRTRATKGVWSVFGRVGTTIVSRAEACLIPSSSDWHDNGQIVCMYIEERIINKMI